MNYPMQNKHQLKNLEDMASSNWENVPHAKNSAMQAMKMKAALEMVLAFHSSEPWTAGRGNDWNQMQLRAGREFPRDSATTKVLCDTIREVLGLQEESMAAREA